MKRQLALAVFSAFAFTHCQNPVDPSGDKGTVNLSPLEKRVVASSNAFGLNLFRQVNAQEHDRNVFVSPLSVSMALGMTLNGANGATRDSMEQTLAFVGISPQEINETYQSLVAFFAQLDPQVKFQIANSIWHRNTFSVEQPFIDVNRQYFDAEVNSLDFSDPAAPGIINNWVSIATHGKITTIIDRPIPREMVMYLINAIYFKGTWTSEFGKGQTRDDYFNGPGGARFPCKMMSHKAQHRYGMLDGVQALDLSYGNADYSMLVLLPAQGTDIDAFIASADFPRYLADSLHGQDVIVFLPAFKLEYKIDLKETLSAMGMGIAFSQWADFAKIHRNGGLSISEVNHKTFVEVNEEGTEAAAVTEVGIGRTSLGPTTPTFRADRPFVFVIRENQSGTVVFVGKIVTPTL